MRSREKQKSIARASLWMLAGLLLSTGLLPGKVVGAHVPQRAYQETAALAAPRNLEASRPQRSSSAPAPTVTGITPDSGANMGIVHITDLAGSNFQVGAAVTLTRTSTAIPGTGVSVVSTSTITVDFDLTGAATGTWDVVVTNPDGQSGVLPEGFTVRPPSSVYLPSVIRNWPRIEKLNPIADAVVIQAYPAINAGHTVDMWVGYDHCPDTQYRINRSLLRFNLSEIPASANIMQARLLLRLVNSCDIGQRTHQVTVYRTGSAWEELSVTWNNQPSYAEAYGSASIPSRTWGWYSFEVTNLVRGWVNGSITNHGLVVRGPESSGDDSARLGFATRESPGTLHDPYLEVTFTDNGTAALGGTLPVDAIIPGPAPSGPTIRELLSGFPRVWDTEAPGFVEQTEGVRD